MQRRAQGKLFRPSLAKRGEATAASPTALAWLMRMVLHLYIDLADRPSAESREVAPGVVLDFDVDRDLVGIDIDEASLKLDLSRVETIALPLAG